MQVRTLISAAVALLSIAAIPAQATLVQLCGPAVCYEYDDNPGVNAGITSFGSPTLLGSSDTLEFTPTSFSAVAVGVNGFDQEVATFQFTRVWTTWSSWEIGQISVAESGDYQIIGSGNTVNSNLRLQVVDKVNDDLLPPFPETATVINNFNTSIATGVFVQNWNLAAQVNPAALFTDLASVVDLQIQNTLQAFTGENGGLAQIQKKLVLVVGLTVAPNQTVVPVPAAAWLFGSALGLMGLVRRRRLS
jgi:hypothetical protein